MIDCECEVANLIVIARFGISRIVIARANTQSNPRITLHPVIARQFERSENNEAIYLGDL
ncbi:hypothetical protein ACWIUD_02270 [Helicobacter sp. 23-1044]